MSKRLNKFGKELGRFLEFYNINMNDFAERIDTTPKNLIDIIEGRVALSFNMICNIAFITEISADYIFTVEENFKIDKNIDKYLEENNITLKKYLKKFDFKELHEKYGVNIRDERCDYAILEDIFKYLRIIDPKLLYKEDNHIFYKSKNDKPELLALWLERCYRVIQEQEIKEYKKENIDNLVHFIKEEAKNNRFDKEKLIKEFNKKGIFLAIEEDLKGSKIIGAFKVLNNKPAIYLTPKYKRCGDIYFALLHELAHCKSDFNRAKNGSIISLEDGNSSSDYEIRADKTAFNWMIKDEDYKEIIHNKDFHDKKYIPSFVVYRLAHDKYIKYNSKEYQEYNKIIV
ncbi:MAG: helix-turn-helix transcriptional regulator [Bacilli bacterium]|nr:helix-turn-helix transcriptional regulator [Bacilli bacterium]